MEPRHEEEMERRSWVDRLHLGWPMLFVVGWLLYELTAQPGLGALVACAKFGWSDMCTAFWLRRVDPDHRRGQTCFWAYLTYGLWKIAAIATLALITFGILDDLVRIPRPQAPKGAMSVLGAMTTAIAMGFSLSLPTAYIALWSAWQNGVRIWLGHAPTQARKERFWPPRKGRVNMALFVASTTILLTIFVLIGVGSSLIALIQHLLPNNAVVKMISPAMPAVILLAIMVFFPIALRRRFAASPGECWITEEGEEAFQAQPLEESKN